MTDALDAAGPRLAERRQAGPLRPDRQPPPSPQQRTAQQQAAKPAAEKPPSAAKPAADVIADSASTRAAERAAQRAARLAARRQEGSGSSEPPPPPEAVTPSTAAAPEPSPTLFQLLQKLPPLPRPKLPRIKLPRLRLLPALVFAAVIMLGDVWDALTAGPPTMAMVEPAPALAAGDPDAPEEHPAEEHEVTAAETEHSAADDGEHGAEVDRHVEDQGDVHAETDPQGAGSEDLTAEEVALLQRLSERRDALENREQALTQREALLRVAEQRIDEKIEELTALRTQIEGLMGLADEEQEEHLVSLVNIYETMRPTDAAAIFNGLDMDVLIDVLQRMREQKSAPILAAMEPERARMVTSELVMRRDLPELPE